MINQGPDPLQQPSPDRRAVVVMLVDDQQFVGTAVGQLLAQESDIELHCCDKAAEAVARANRIAPSVILQDLVMPDVDGLTLMRQFRANPLTSGTPVIVLSGNDDADTRARAMAEGAADFLVKLPPKADLIACIRRHALVSADSGSAIDAGVLDKLQEAVSPEFTRRLIDQFLGEAASLVQAVQDAGGREDHPALKATAHSLKGSSMIMGATKLAALCAQIEELAQRPGSTVTPAALAEVGDEFGRVRDALTTRRNGEQL